MARLRQSGGASGVRKVPQSLWERAGERAGNGAGALFARLDAQDAQDALDAQEQTVVVTDQTRDHARTQAALTLERLAAQIRAGAWSAEIAALVAAAHNALGTPPAEASEGQR